VPLPSTRNAGQAAFSSRKADSDFTLKFVAKSRHVHNISSVFRGVYSNWKMSFKYRVLVSHVPITPCISSSKMRKAGVWTLILDYSAGRQSRIFSWMEQAPLYSLS